MSTKNVYLAHHGVKGMRWGVRRAPSSGSSSAGSKFKAKPKTEDDDILPSKDTRRMSDADLAAALKRVRMETEYTRIMKESAGPDPHPYVTRGRKVAEDILFNGIQQGGTEIIKAQITTVGNTLIKSASANKKGN